MDLKIVFVLACATLVAGCSSSSDTDSYYQCHDKTSAECRGKYMSSGHVINERGQADRRMQQIQQRGQQDNSTDGGARFGW
ncbi:hypothetical protein QVN42_15210 [Yersinia nurmii]|uniref:Lipoprotein n=1 Tax=Yersinia nurmii TaxID=685706 RepID=A0AAW7K051_9GAMM|nr:hypothetical protein [Yersinia nurmii]MDN0088703.1 hypothetical protein [Yersinia nurmii]CNE94467.1 Uncharacterised protein [Yersinia nurmii]